MKISGNIYQKKAARLDFELVLLAGNIYQKKAAPVGIKKSRNQVLNDIYLVEREFAF